MTDGISEGSSTWFASPRTPETRIRGDMDDAFWIVDFGRKGTT